MSKKELNKHDNVFESRTLHSEDNTIQLNVVHRGHVFSGVTLDLRSRPVPITDEKYIKFQLYPMVYEVVLGDLEPTNKFKEMVDGLTNIEIKQLCEILIRAESMGWMDHIKY